MGNISSTSDSEEDLRIDYNEDDSASEGEHDIEKDVTPMLDFQSLFDHTTLRSAVARVRDEMPENVIQQHQQYLLRCLQDRLARNQTTLTRSQFCDVLMSQSVSREDAVQAFRHFDSELDGETNIEAMLEGLKTSSADMHSDRGYIVRTLQACSLTPGFIDVYSEDKETLGQHGSKLLSFLLQNRAAVTSLPFPYLTGFNNTMDMRLAALQHHFHSLKDNACLQQEEGLLSDGEELKPITRCFKSLEVSTNKFDAYKLTNDDPSSYWQSDGPARSHWIRLRMRNNVVIKQLSVLVAVSDQSYMPQLITVSVGKNCLSLREIKDIKVPSHLTGEVVLLENCKQFYPVIQINIKRCHSDGCDTRIHALKTLGYRVVKENGVSVMDASVSWYLQVMSSTAIATLSMAPHLRGLLLDHSRNALRHMGPLSLCPNSSEKPAFLTTHVLNEIDSFLSQIALDAENKITTEGLYIELAFNLARGHVAGTLRNLLILQENEDLTIDPEVLHSLKTVRDSFWKRQGMALPLTLAGCDGGQKDDNTPPNNVLSANWSATQAYMSGDGKTKVNMFFKAADFVQLTKVRIKVDKGAKGPRRGLVFIYQDKEGFDLARHVARFETYDSWTAKEYNFCNKVRGAGLGGMPDNPVAYFTLEDDWDEAEITPDVCPAGQYILVKFLEARQASAERLSIIGIKFHGFPRQAVFFQNPPVDTEGPEGPNGVVHMKILDFLVSLARDQVPPKKCPGSRKPQVLDMTDLSVELLWNLYKGFQDVKCQNMTLQLLHALFPFLAEAKDDRKDAREEMFSHLCRAVDTTPTGEHSHLLDVIKQVIIDGAAVFFPDKEARRKQLFSMMADINTTTECQSVALIFHSLCQFFSVIDPSGLLDLPATLDKSFKMEPVLAVMDMLVEVAYREFVKVLNHSEVTEQSSHLIHLLCSLQTSLLVWVHQHTDNQSSSPFAEELLIKYVKLICDKLTKALQNLVTFITVNKTFTESQKNQETLAKKADKVFEKKAERDPLLEKRVTFDEGIGSQEIHLEDIQVPQQPGVPHATETLHSKDVSGTSANKRANVETERNTATPNLPQVCSTTKVDEMLKKLEKTFLATSVRQMLLILSLLCERLSSKTRVEILKCMSPILTHMKAVAISTSHVCYSIDSKQWEDMQCEEVVLRTWDVESAHNYDNNQHATEVFSCPGASTFIIDFDPRCETEKRYDYLEFTDSRGVKLRFDQKVGTEKWPVTVTFKGGHRLQFLFHSDSSNNEWGYKFKVTALGCPDMPLNWLFDLELSLCKVCGAYSGATLDAHLVTSKMEVVESDEGDCDMRKSELWTSLFRGGFLVGKLQRSLSGKLITDEDKDATFFLLDMVESMEAGKTEGLEADFLQKCLSQCGAPHIGGVEINNTIAAVFAALLWHTQYLREEINHYIEKSGEGNIKEGILQAYSAAESLRTVLMEQRQKWKVNESQMIDLSKEANPVTQCKDKALFLLKFAGLTKLPSRSDSRAKLTRKVSTVNRLQGFHHGKSIKLEGIFEKYPSFRLVLDFVTDSKWSVKRVEQLLKEGSNQAKAVSTVYSFAADYLKTMGESHIFQLPTVLFMQEMLRYQAHFPKHYADNLEGCGLDLESRVRGSYYKLINCLVTSLRETTRSQLKKPVMYAYDYMQACTLHLLDMKWQQYDLFFLDELKIPDFYITVAKGSVSMREKLVGEICEDEELALYKREMEWLQECKKHFEGWYGKAMKCPADQKKVMQMFVAKYSDLLEVEISCDGCNVTLPGRRYRCLQCQDMDICATCYLGGVKPGGEHSDDHEIVHMMYKCDECQAFIVGTRIHCNSCEDFDLCLGCHNQRHFPGGHKEDHAVTKIPTVKLRLNTDADTSLQSYVHQHVWLLYSSLALSMANIIYNSSRLVIDVDSDYIKACIKLHNSCMELAFKCLMQVSPSDDTAEEDPSCDLESRQHRAFAVHSQERMMGLLGAMIPPENKVPVSEEVNYTFKSVQFFKLLFTIAMGESGHDSNTQHMAMALIGQLLQRATISCSECDEAVALAKGQPVPEDEISGRYTASFLFSFGATCLERSGIEWANSMASVLQYLISCPSWRDVLFLHLTHCISVLTECPVVEEPDLVEDTAMVEKADLMNILIKQKGLTEEKANDIWSLISNDKATIDRKGYVKALSYCRNIQHGLPVSNLQTADTSQAPAEQTSPLSSLFALFVIAGFPEVLSVGSQVKYTDVAMETKNGVVLKHFPDKNQSLIIDKKSRKRVMVNDEHVECKHYENEVFDLEHIQVFVKVTYNITTQIKQEESVSIEHLWLLGLSLKALLHVLVHIKVPELVCQQFVQCIVHLASQPTTFSKHWLLKDLEILSLKLYTGERLQEEDKKERVKEKHDEAKDKLTTEAKQHPMDGLSDQDKQWFLILQDNFQIPLPVIRALYEKENRDIHALLVSFHEQYTVDGEFPDDELKEMAKAWETTEPGTDMHVDTGMEINPPAPEHNKVLEAVPEPSEENQRLLSNERDHCRETRKHRKSNSNSLLRRARESHASLSSKEYLAKVNMAIVIMYARQLLTKLLADWPADGHIITAQLIGCQDNTQVPYVLDLLNSSDSNELFKKVVENVIKHSEEKTAFALTACQFMEEVNLVNVIKESEHNYKENTHFFEKVQIPGASHLWIHFDSRCNTEEKCDELTMSFSPDFPADKIHVFSGPRDCWVDFEIPGDTLYYKFVSDSSNNGWGYKFTVTGGKLGRFETGYLILSCILSMPHVISNLPQEQLWENLMYVACKQTGQQRLKALHLLIKLMQAQFRLSGCEKLRLDLTLLRPLWQLYNDMADSTHDAGNITSQLARALTEFFFIAENLALDWEVEKEYVVSLLDDTQAHNIIFQGVLNVAAVSTMIGVTNKATEAVSHMVQELHDSIDVETSIDTHAVVNLL